MFGIGLTLGHSAMHNMILENTIKNTFGNIKTYIINGQNLLENLNFENLNGTSILIIENNCIS